MNPHSTASNGQMLHLAGYADNVAQELHHLGIPHHIAYEMITAHPDAIVRGYSAGPDTVQATANAIIAGTPRNDTHDGIPI